jgi:hypothetical protein
MITVVAVMVVGAALAAAAAAGPTSGEFPPTWHIHDCNVALCVLPHAGVAFFPTILTGGSVSAYLQDPAACPDATDKAFLGGGEPPQSSTVTPPQPLREGVCMTSTTIIHLKSIPTGQPGPDGWSSLAPSGGYTTFYSLTGR